MLKRSESSVAAGSLRDRHKMATTQALEDAAFRLFAEKGYRDTSVDEIAATAGVSRSTFFRYFGSKEALVMTRAHQMGARYADLLRRRPPDERPLQALEEALVQLTREALEASGTAELRRRSAMMDSDPDLAAKEAEARNHWIGVISRVLADRAGRSEPTIEESLASALLIEISRHASEALRTTDEPAEDRIRKDFAVARRLAQ